MREVHNVCSLVVVDHLTACLNDFEKFLHDTTLPVLIKARLMHVQFETIHPFLDGNGRLGRARLTCEKILEYMKHLPQVNISLLTHELKITPPTARAALNRMVSIGILRESTQKHRSKIYIYTEYLNILEKGVEPL
jgi:Fic family protein